MHTSDGFITTDDAVFMSQLVGLLNQVAPQLEASLQHTGGGIFCVRTNCPDSGQFIYWGMQEDTWCADINNDAGDHLDIIQTTVPSLTRDLKLVVESISTIALARNA